MRVSGPTLSNAMPASAALGPLEPHFIPQIVSPLNARSTYYVFAVESMSRKFDGVNSRPKHHERSTVLHGLAWLTGGGSCTRLAELLTVLNAAAELPIHTGLTSAP
jgi:hypothetical protein